LGFGNTIAKGTLAAVREKGLLGALTGGLTASSGGIAASIFFGLMAAMMFKTRRKP
jgi:stage V sporulation protein AE